MRGYRPITVDSRREYGGLALGSKLLMRLAPDGASVPSAIKRNRESAGVQPSASEGEMAGTASDRLKGPSRLARQDQSRRIVMDVTAWIDMSRNNYQVVRGVMSATLKAGT
jgi:hypothetical protein